MCQRLNTGESNNFYFGIFICIGSLNIPACSNYHIISWGKTLTNSDVSLSDIRNVEPFYCNQSIVSIKDSLAL